MMHMM
jgi:hypothetical protein